MFTFRVTYVPEASSKFEVCFILESLVYSEPKTYGPKTHNICFWTPVWYQYPDIYLPSQSHIMADLGREVLKSIYPVWHLRFKR